jgi:hypothetical protein
MTELSRRWPAARKHGEEALCQAPNKQLQRTVIRRRGDAAGAPFHYAPAARFTRQRAAAELRRYAADSRETGVSMPPTVGRQWVDEGEAGASHVEPGWLDGDCATRQPSPAQASQ